MFSVQGFEEKNGKGAFYFVNGKSTLKIEYAYRIYSNKCPSIINAPYNFSQPKHQYTNTYFSHYLVDFVYVFCGAGMCEIEITTSWCPGS